MHFSPPPRSTLLRAVRPQRRFGARCCQYSATWTEQPGVGQGNIRTLCFVPDATDRAELAKGLNGYRRRRVPSRNDFGLCGHARVSVCSAVCAGSGDWTALSSYLDCFCLAARRCAICDQRFIQPIHMGVCCAIHDTPHLLDGPRRPGIEHLSRSDCGAIDPLSLAHRQYLSSRHCQRQGKVLQEQFYVSSCRKPHRRCLQAQREVEGVVACVGTARDQCVVACGGTARDQH